MRHVFVIATSETCSHCIDFERTYNKDNNIIRTLERSDRLRVIPLKSKSMNGHDILASLKGTPKGMRLLVQYFPSFIMVNGADWDAALGDESNRQLRAFIYNHDINPTTMKAEPRADAKPPSLENLRSWITSCIAAFDSGSGVVGGGNPDGAYAEEGCRNLRIVPRFSSSRRQRNEGI